MSLLQYIRRKFHNLTHPILGRVLMLHRVVEQQSEGENRELEVTLQFLEQTIEDYRREGYRFVSIDEACSLIQAGKRPTQPFVCLTFDDGYRDNYTLALPLLKRLDVPFVVYVSTDFVDNKHTMWWYPGQQLGLSLDEMKALAAEPLCTIGAHTLSHPRLDTLSSEAQRQEIVESKALLEQWLGQPIHHFSYPHGAYNDDTVAIVRDCGFHSALCAWGGTIRRGDNPYLLHRIALHQQ